MSKLLIKIDEPVAPPAAAGWALWQLGFRPFYLLAGAFAALSGGLWALQFSGGLPRPYLPGAIWHAHEMLFGYALAVVVGFLFTAGRNWSGRPTPTGPTLAALALLWLAGRVLVLTPFAWTAAVVNAAFPLAAATALAGPLVRARNRRSYFLVGLLALLGLAQFTVHAAMLGALPWTGKLAAWVGINIGLDVVLFIIAVMAGRVVPMFTNNGVPGASARRHPRLEWLALSGLLAVLAADALGLHGPALAAHALTVGAVGGMTLGMMTRTSRGHCAPMGSTSPVISWCRPPRSCACCCRSRYPPQRCRQCWLRRCAGLPPSHCSRCATGRY